MTRPIPQRTARTAAASKGQPDPAVLRQLYLDDRRTVNEIAALLSIKRARVSAALKAAGIEWRSSRRQCPVEVDRLRSMVADGAARPATLARRYGVARNTAARWLAEAGLLDKDPAIDERRLRELYVDQQLTTREVAAALGVNKTRILLALASAGIVARPWAVKRPGPAAASITTGSRIRSPSAELRDQAAELYRTGQTIQAVAGKLKGPPTTVRLALHAARTPFRDVPFESATIDVVGPPIHSPAAAC